MVSFVFQIERLAQYERLVGGGCARRRAARLSDLERVQDLFPHDYLALHDADAPAALASHHAQVRSRQKELIEMPVNRFYVDTRYMQQTNESRG